MASRVLYVDDSPVARAVAVRLLEARGLEVVIASSVEEAAQIDASTFGVALLDLEVGNASGADLATTLRLVRPSLALAFLTAAADRTALARAQALGPVFRKESGLDQAVEWVAGAAGIG